MRHISIGTMKSAVLAGPREIRIEEIPIPVPEGDSVRVRLDGCGVCGSNLAPWQGRPWMKYPQQPGAPGHEGWGVVDAIGEGVTNLVPGDRVALLSYNAFAEYDLAPERCVAKLPMSLASEPFPGEALACAANVYYRSEIEPGQTVAIVGVGFLGAALVSMANASGATVIAMSRRPMALEFAHRFGAKHALCLGERSRLVADVLQLTDNKGCDCVIEATGFEEPLNLAAEITRVRGRLVIAGYHQESRNVNMQLWNWRGLDVINAHERDPAVYMEGMQRAINAVADGALMPGSLYTHQFPLERISEAFEVLESRPANFMKVLVQCSQ